MRIISMTATFGKLEHQTLTLKTGLNIIEAPNEWGKSTWCAFLVAMLYGIDTRSHSTKNALADKEHYAPWSGSPMSGSMELEWDGRRITIQRSTKGRVPMGEFSAFETESGLTVPELTADNCGQVLLGVEKSVFTRSGFIKLTDLPVTQDETLLRRLNALVTTGDDSGDAENLERKLKELRNRCRYNKSGLIPQAEEEREQLNQRLCAMEERQTQYQQLRKHHKETLNQIKKLENHRVALRYLDAQDDARRVAQAQAHAEEAKLELEALQAQCAELPTREQATQAMERLIDLQRQHTRLEKQLAGTPVEEHPIFGTLSGEAALNKARSDTDAYVHAGMVKPLPVILCALVFVIGLGLLVVLPGMWYVGAVVLLGGLGLLGWVLLDMKKRRQYRRDIHAVYGAAPETWIPMAKEYALHHDNVRQKLERQMEQLAEEIEELCEGEPVEELISQCSQIIAKHDVLNDAQKSYDRAVSHAKTVQAMATQMQEPEFDDELELTGEETARLLDEALEELRQTQLKMGQVQGQIESLGSEEELKGKLSALRQRLMKLEDTYAAASIALEALQEAKAELQRRFAPRLAKRAQSYFATMTGNRYNKLTMDQELGLLAGGEHEDILRSALWRSDGTADQLYLALRLAVAAELTPRAPLILDDALVRFDDVRLKAAVELLKDEGRRKQVILFTCQGREAKI